jgi:predicted ATP-grasp superfamily ATP-dependent carboligase
MKVADVSTPVLVLSRGMHGPLGIIRSLGRLGVPMYAVRASKREVGGCSRYCRQVFRWEFPQSQPGPLLEVLRKARCAIGRQSILIPTSDDTSVFVADHADVLREFFLFPEQCPALPRALASKKEAHALARTYGIPTPDAMFPQSRTDVANFAKGATYPIMLKAIDGARCVRRTGVTMLIVRSSRELLEKYDELEDPAEPNLMLQEYIPGEDDTIWMFNGYFNRDSECLFGMTGKKIRQSPVARGITSLGICLKNPVVEETTVRFMKALGYRGILDIGYRYDARDCQYKLLDVNPRIGCTFRLFVAENGMDAARALYLDLTGQPVPASTSREGRKWLVELPDLKSSIEYHRLGKLTLRNWVDSFSGVEETAQFAWDDPWPFVNICAQSGLSLLRRLFAKRSERRKPEAAWRFRRNMGRSGGVAN